MTFIQLGKPTAFEPAWYNVRFIPYLMTGCAYVKPLELESGEVLEVNRLPLREFVGKILRGNFARDAKTLVTAFLALPRLGFPIF